ncbi:hypothetical protein Back2_17290 [Nocardioides baekrokdamisoli]|uniref:Ricin B lectin domain-containing protein n=1 Tax=Nocardioides baekrokdamisoli TaxID=1804624 RepID=A0A3G9IGX4_9ACTN|nr:ricin-type beta-trefoil lectin domain protein [Nocardioides baekrokdamisoli]BBH17442.1 hypothetical protein Back2_17290 [Nocardioides baekrokdamisoli]
MSVLRPHRRLRVAAAVAMVASGLSLVAAPAAHADGPGSGTAYSVALGDSYISGEAGRWAGNVSGTNEPPIDALGSGAYNDTPDHSAETITRCHRSGSAEIYLDRTAGGGTYGQNLACSGATTATHWDSKNNFKPGIDFYDDGSGHQGQAKMLQNFAAGHNVTMVVLSIGGNDFGFADIVQNCVTDFLYSPSSSPDYCYDDNTTTSRINQTNANAIRDRIRDALLNINTAMTNAGYTSSQWTLMLQDYPMPLERSTEARYGDSGYTAQSTGGCGFWKGDLNYAANVMLPMINNTVWAAADAANLPNLKRLYLDHAMDNHRLCQRGVDLADNMGYSSPWQDPLASAKEEWINQIHTVSASNSDFFIQESLHPNYWGQLALRNCLRQAWNNGSPTSGWCQPSYAWGNNAGGEPNMTFSSTYAAGYQPPHRLFNIGGPQSSRCIDVPGNSSSSGSVLELYDCNGGGNQNFTYDLTARQLHGTGSQTGLCFGLQNNSTAWATRVIMQNCDANNSLQRWTLNASQQIINDATGACFDANGGGQSNGTQLLIWGCGGTDNQKWWYGEA